MAFLLQWLFGEFSESDTAANTPSKHPQQRRSLPSASRHVCSLPDDGDIAADRDVYIGQMVRLAAQIERLLAQGTPSLPLTQNAQTAIRTNFIPRYRARELFAFIRARNTIVHSSDTLGLADIKSEVERGRTLLTMLQLDVANSVLLP